MSRFHSLKKSHLFTLLLTLMLCLGSCATKAQGSGKPKPSDYGIKSKKALDAYLQGQSDAKNRDYKQAVKDYEAAIELEPNFGDAWFQAGACAHAMREFALGYKFLTKTKEIVPSPNPMLYLFLANCALELEKYDEAAKNYDEFLALKPTISANDLKNAERNRKNAHYGAAMMKNPVDFKAVNVGDNINSIGEEYLPNLTADGQTIFFTARRPGCTGGYSAEYSDFTEDFYFSEMVDGKWKPCANLGPPVNTERNEGAASFSPDGQFVFFAGCGRKDGYGDCDIYVSKLTGNVWSAPQNLGPIVNSPQWDSQPSISNDGKTLYFASTRPGGKGGYDIWYTTLEKNHWTEPKNLGEPINTEGSELCPFIHADGKTLYFSSDLHPGFGKLDLFVTRSQGNGWTQPQNLGYPINTSGSEGNIFVNTKGDVGYINSSKEGGLGKSDIYRFELDEKIRPSFTTYVRGIVTDKTTGKPLDAEVIFINVATRDTIRNVTTNSVTGKYQLTLPLEKDYAAFIDKKGYLFSSNFFSLKNVDPKTTPYYDVNIALEPLRPGIEVVMSAIFYETNKFMLLDASKPELEHMVYFLKLNKNLRVEIGGHTDNVGSDSDNLTLSQNRALEVRKYLIDRGIKADRIESKGYGETQPMTSNDTEEGRALNRRTVCKIIEI
jgi:outer membrane protein OmpA-like peptidoglycan-associated protein/Tol biopolymer transport system component